MTAREIPLTGGRVTSGVVRVAAADAEARGDRETVCHGDPSPCNFVFVNEVPVGIIDFDAARAGARREDVGYAAWLWLSIGDDRLSPLLQGRRLRVFVDAYGAIDASDALPALLAIQTEFAERPGAPVQHSEWAKACRAWVERHIDAVRAGAGA